MGREDIKWQELLQHFRFVQARHEKARRQAMGTDVGRGSMLGSDEDATRGGGVFDANGEQQTGSGISASASRFGVGGASASPGGGGSRPYMRRRVTGESSAPTSAPVASGSGSGSGGGTNLIPRSVLSPLNPKARTQHGFFGSMSQAVTGGPGGGQEKAMSPTSNAKSLPPAEKATALQHLKRTTPGAHLANVKRG